MDTEAICCDEEEKINGNTNAFKMDGFIEEAVRRSVLVCLG
jgi:hypothetical protein